MVGGDTIFYEPTWSKTWCECLDLSSRNNRSVDDITLRRLPVGVQLPLDQQFNYSLSQTINNANLLFEYWEAILHPGAKAKAVFSFNFGVNVYFAPRFYVDGQDHDPDYEDHYVVLMKNVTNGEIVAPPINASETWAFVFEKNFKLQTTTFGSVNYTFQMVEYALPKTDVNDTDVGAGRFCWDAGNMNSSWFLSAKWTGTIDISQQLTADLKCVPRYALTIPIMCIPVVIFIVVEILILVFCICKKRRPKYVEV